MLDQQDLKQLETLLEGTENKLTKFVQTELQKTKKELKDELLVVVGEVIEQQVLPQIRDVVKEEVAVLPTKSYLDDKLADLKGDLVVKMRKLDEKQDFTMNIHKEHGTLTEEDVRRIKQEFQVFPTNLA